MDFLWVLLIGYALGVIHVLVLEKGKSKPLSLKRATRFSYSTQVRLVPPSRLGEWRRHTASFLLIGERLKYPLSYREMARLTGLSRRDQTVYREVLMEGRVIDVRERGKIVFLMSKGMRRLVLSSLPYPTDADPPKFGLL